MASAPLALAITAQTAQPRTYRCSHCGEPGHRRTVCPQLGLAPLLSEETRARNRAYSARWHERHRDRVRERGDADREADRLRNRAWRKANPARVRETNLATALRKYGLRGNKPVVRRDSQGGRCAICAAADGGRRYDRRLLVDHCHKTGRVRGLLCHSCNAMLGYGRESATILRDAASYIDRFQSNNHSA